MARHVLRQSGHGFTNYTENLRQPDWVKSEHVTIICLFLLLDPKPDIRCHSRQAVLSSGT